MSGKYAGMLQGMQYIDRREDIAQQRQDKLNEMEYNRGRQETVDNQNKQLFENQMRNLEIKQTKAMLPFFASKYKDGIVADDIELLQQVHKGMNLSKYTGVDVIQNIDDSDIAAMRAQGIIKEGYTGNAKTQFIKGVTTGPEGMKTKYMDVSMYGAALGLNQYLSDKERNSILATLNKDKLQGEVDQIGKPKPLDPSVVNKNNSIADLNNQKTADLKKPNNEKNQKGLKLALEIKNLTLKHDKLVKEKDEVKSYEIARDMINNKQLHMDADNPTLKRLQQYEFKNMYAKDSAKRSVEVTTLLNQMKVADSIRAGIFNNDDETVTGAMARKVATLKNVFSSADNKKELSEPEIATVIGKRIGLNSKMAGYVAKLIKDQSGAAVTEQEVTRKLTEIFGGAVGTVNKSTMLASFDAHIAHTARTANSMANGGLADNMPVTFYRLQKRTKNRVNIGMTPVAGKHKKSLSSYGGN